MKIILYFDGASRGNPGIAGAGAYLCTEPFNNKYEWKLRKFLGNKTNNQAEYYGIIIGLNKVIELIEGNIFSISELVIRGDSQLIIRQLNGQYKVKSKNIVDLFSQSKILLSKIKYYGIKFRVEHIYRTLNKIADQLANQGIDNENNIS